MVKKFSGSDIDPILDIWLSASIKAHDFIEASFWESQVENMRNIYIPVSETYVFESEQTDEHTGHQEYTMCIGT